MAPSTDSIMLVNGRYFDHLAPDPSVIDLGVLEHGLAAPRFNNQTIRPISIAEHSLRVRRIVVELLVEDDDAIEAAAQCAYDEARISGPYKVLNTWDSLPPNARENWRRKVREAGVGADAELWALLHDAHEALVPWGDCLRPGKLKWMRDAEEVVDSAILVALNTTARARDLIVGIGGSQRSAVKTADSIALYFEAMLWQPGALDWAPDLRATKSFAEACRVGGAGSTSAVERFLPLIAPRPGESWRLEVEKLLGKRARS